MIVEQGKVVDICAEPGEYTYGTGSAPSLLSGDLSEEHRQQCSRASASALASAGRPGSDQRIYYFNTQELAGNKYGTPNPVPFRVVDQRAGIDIDIAIRCFGEYSYRITNPILFYTNVCGNVEKAYTRDEMDGQLKSELMTALQPAFAKISEKGIRYSALPGHTDRAGRGPQRGAERQVEQAARHRDRILRRFQREGQRRRRADAQGNAAQCSLYGPDPRRRASGGRTGLRHAGCRLQHAAGPAMAFMGMNQAAAAGGVNARDLYQMGGQQTAAQPQAAPAAGWTCSCGQTGNTGKFCAECGKPGPEAPAVWVCSCGTTNSGKFCQLRRPQAHPGPRQVRQVRLCACRPSQSAQVLPGVR